MADRSAVRIEGAVEVKRHDIDKSDEVDSVHAVSRVLLLSSFVGE